MYCHNCNLRMNADDLESSGAHKLPDGKVLCSKCAPLFVHNTTYLQTLPLPGKGGRSTDQANWIDGLDEDRWSRGKLLRVIVGGGVLIAAAAFVIWLLCH